MIRKTLLAAMVIPLLLLALASCSQPTHRSTKPEVLQQAANYYRDSRPVLAIQLINAYLASDKITVEEQSSAYSLLGDIHFSKQDYGAASTYYMRARTASPENYYAVHRYWGALLMQNPEKRIRDGILDEIGKLAKDSAGDARALLAAYKGYTYFWDRTKQISTLKRLLHSRPDPEVESELPYLIMEEMIYMKSSGQRFELAEIFFSRFPDHVNLPTIASMVFPESGLDPNAQKFLDARNKKTSLDPFMRFHLARYLLLQKKDQAQAMTHLRVLLKNIDAPVTSHCNNPDTLRTCDYYWTGLKANVHWLYAQLLMKQGKLIASLEHVTRATSINPQSAISWRLKGHLHARSGNPQLARQALIQALNIRPDHKSTLKQLKKLDSELVINSPANHVGHASDKVAPVFSDITAQSGLDGQKAQRVAWGDFNNDGFDDLLLDGNRLYLNVHGKRFRDITSSSGISRKQSTTGGLFVDYNNDGLLDVLVTGRRTVLYKNLDGSTFEPAHTFNKDQPRRTVAASFGDFNNDGYADLYLANYEKGAVQRAVCFDDQLFINQPGKRFEDLSHLIKPLAPYGLCGRGVIWSDLDQDGQQEIVLSNYRLNRNLLIKRTSANVLKDVSRQGGFQGQKNGHSIAAVSADFDGDGKPDIYQTNLAHPRYLHFSDSSHLYLNSGGNGDIKFSVSNTTGIDFDETNADVTAADFDNDGDLDLFMTSVYPGQFSSLYINDGKARFRNVSWLSGAQVSNGWGSAAADFDNDGDTDLAIASSEGVRLLRNDSPRSNRLKVAIRNRQCQYNGTGMKLWLTAGNNTYYREIQSGKGTGTQDSASIIFGLGAYQGKLNLRAVDLCGNQFRWTGTVRNKTITIS